MIEDLRQAKRQLEHDKDQLASQRKHSHSIKNIERMRQEINKRIEYNMLEIIKILDDNTKALGLSVTDEDEELSHQLIATDTILKCSAISAEDIDEKVKAKFMTRLVREYRRNRERAK